MYWSAGAMVEPPPTQMPAASDEIETQANVGELVELIIDYQQPFDVKIQAAIMLQHVSYLDPFVKAEVISFNVAHHILNQLAQFHRNPNIPHVYSLSLLGALRNLCSGADSTARNQVAQNGGSGIAVLLDIIAAHQSAEPEETAIRELTTAVLWNISVDPSIVQRLTEEGVLDVLSRAIILPSVQFATKTSYSTIHTWAGWQTDFRNSVGVLRNATAQLSPAIALVSGQSGVAPLRLLIEGFTVAVRFSVTQQDTESKAVENVVCFLQNITAAICAESNYGKSSLKRANSTPNGFSSYGNDDDHAKSSLGCALVGSQWCLSRQAKNATMLANGQSTMSTSQIDTERQLISVHCVRSLVEALLPLLADCSNPTTLEAGLGIIRNVVSITCPTLKLREIKANAHLTSLAEPGCADVARESVWRHGGLAIIVDLLSITSDGVMRSAASALAALGTGAKGAVDTDGILVIRELIGKQALDRLVLKVPTPTDAALSESFASDAAICALLAAILVIIKPFSQQQQAAFHQQIMTPSSPAAFSLHAVSDLSLVSRMLFLIRPERFGCSQIQFDSQVRRLAQSVLATLWQHVELRQAYARLGIDRSSFFPVLLSPRVAHQMVNSSYVQQQQLLQQQQQQQQQGLEFSHQVYKYSDHQQVPVEESGVAGEESSYMVPTIYDQQQQEENQHYNERLIAAPDEPGSIESRRGSSTASWAGEQQRTAINKNVEGDASTVSLSSRLKISDENKQPPRPMEEAERDEKEEDDSDMFAPSQLELPIECSEVAETGADEGEHESRSGAEEDAVNKNNEKEKQQQIENGDEKYDDKGSEEKGEEERGIETGTEATEVEKSEQTNTVAGGGGNSRDLFLLALESDAPDSWV